MCTYRAESSFGLALKGVYDILGQGFKKFRGDSKFPFCETYGPQSIDLGWDRANFSNGHIPFAKDNGFPFGKAFKIPGKMGLRFMYVNSNHDPILA